MTPPDIMVPSWDQYFMTLADAVAARSKDRSTKVGCVIVGPDNEIRSTGYNSFPRGMNDDVAERHERPEKYKWTEHAERNAIYNAARIGTGLKGSRMYCSHFPCMDCARGLVASGIVSITCNALDPSDPMHARWDEDHKRSRELFHEVGIEIRWFNANHH